MRLIVGSDLIDEVPTWRDGDEILRLAPLLTVPRAGYLQEGEQAELPRLASSEIRGKLYDDQSTPPVPAEVLKFIRRNNLYK